MLTLTIGIPAYNEEKNIYSLLNSLSVQKLSKDVYLKEIIVSSDACSDNTTAEVRRFTKIPVRILENKTRMGLASNQNKIFAYSNSDIAVLLQADIVVKDKDFLQKLIAPIITDHADLTSPEILELTPRNFFEKCLKSSMDFKRQAFNNLNLGSNFFTCHGPARAYSKRLYQTIHYDVSAGEDLYTYLYSLKNGFKFIFSSHAVAYYRLPQNLAEHLKQSHRFQNSTIWIKEKLGTNFVADNLSHPLKSQITAGLKTLAKDPIHFIGYIAIYAYTVITARGNLQEGRINNWAIAQSSKIEGRILYE